MDKPEYLKDNMIEIVLKEVRDDILWWLTAVRSPVPHHPVMISFNCHSWQSSNSGLRKEIAELHTIKKIASFLRLQNL